MSVELGSDTVIIAWPLFGDCVFSTVCAVPYVENDLTISFGVDKVVCTGCTWSSLAYFVEVPTAAVPATRGAAVAAVYVVLVSWVVTVLNTLPLLSFNFLKAQFWSDSYLIKTFLWLCPLPPV